MAVDASGVPLGAVSAPASRHDQPLLVPTLEAVFETLGGPPKQTSVHLGSGYDSGLTREWLRKRGLVSIISETGSPRSCGARSR
jgi:transposase InsO family protein